MSYKMQKRILVFLFLLFPTILLLLFLVYPALKMVYYSFTNWDGVMPTYKMIGISNYKRVFTDSTLWLSLKNNLAYALVAILQNIVALFFAILLNSKLKAREFYKTTIFLPYVINITAIAYMFNFLFDFNDGPINLFLRHIGIAPIKFFSDPHIAIFSLVSMSAWRWMGYQMVIYLAALKSIDPSLYESSGMDGAGAWSTFRYITFPGIIRIVELQLFLALSGAFQAFTESLILTKGGPGKTTYTFLYYIIDSYVNFNNYGYAAAMSVALIMIIITIAGIQRLAVKRGEA